MRSRRSCGAESPTLPVLLRLLLLLQLLLALANSAAYIRPGAPTSRRPITMPASASSLSSSGGASDALLPSRELLPPGPFVVYLTPGVPEAEEGPALEAWYGKVS